MNYRRIKVHQIPVILVYYSPKSSHVGGYKVQAFTSIGKISDGQTYQVQVSEDLCAYRREVVYYPSRDADIRPLLSKLSFTRERGFGWGLAFSPRSFEIPRSDFMEIATAHGLENFV